VPHPVIRCAIILPVDGNQYDRRLGLSSPSPCLPPNHHSSPPNSGQRSSVASHHRKDATIIIMAAGEGKAKVVAAALEKEPSTDHPATCLQTLPGARFYVSQGETHTRVAHR
jgi:hypothetical protein